MLLLLSSSVTAQPADEPPSVYLDVSIEARQRLEWAETQLRDKNFGEAIQILQGLIETTGDKLVPVDSGPNATYVSLRQRCHQILSRLPAEGLKLYRDRVDAQAKELLRKADQEQDSAALERLIADFFCSSVSDAALERLGDRAFTFGRYNEALARWSMLLSDDTLGAAPADNAEEASLRLRYPDPKVEVARVAAKWVLAQAMEGNLPAAKRVAPILKQNHKEAAGKLAGRSGTYWKIVEDVLASPTELEPPSGASDWRTFAGDYRRTRVVAGRIDVGDVEHRWTIETEKDWTPTQRGPAIESARQAQERLGYHPVVVGDRVFVAASESIWSLNLMTGAAEQFPVSDGALNRRDASGPDRFTITAHGRRLFIRTGDASQRARFAGRPFNNRVPTISRLHCWDHVTQRLEWEVASSRIGDQGLVFEGAPVANQDSVFIALTRLDALSETSVACFDITTGRLKWRTVVCETANELGDRSTPLHNLLTLVDDTIYYGTNLGAVAALDTRSGRLRWVTTYARRPAMGSIPAAAFSADLNPAVFHQGRLFVAAADTAKIQCFDAATGRRLWEAHPPTQHMLGVDDGKLIVTGNRVWAIDVETGKVAWYWPENTVPGFGRGLLAGGNVYWPTLREIHVLDIDAGRKAQPSIALQTQLGVKGGNLVFANGNLLVAQSDQVIAISPYRRLIKKLQDKLAAEPKAALLHARLAKAAFEHGDYPLAVDHFRLASQNAGPDEVVDGRALVEFANEKLFDALIAQANAKREQPGAAHAVLAEATRSASTAALKLRAIRAVAELWTAASDPAKELAAYQSVLDDPALRNELLPTAGGARVPAGRWAQEQIGRLIDQHGRSIYAPHESAASRALTSRTEPKEILELADRYPASEAHVKMLLAAADRFVEREQYHDAVLAYRRLLRTSNEPSATRFRVLADLERVHQRQQRWEQAVMLLDQIASEYAGKPRPAGLNQDVDSYLAGQRLELKRRQRLSDSAETVSLARSWSSSGGTNGRLIWPVGDVVSRQHRMLLASLPEKLMSLSCASGEPLWESAKLVGCIWASYGPAGVVAANHSRLACLDYATGTMLWQVTLQPAEWSTGLAPTGSTFPWVTWLQQEERPRENRAKAAGPVLLTPSVNYQLGGDVVVARITPGEIVALDAYDGSILWRRALATDASDATLSIVGSCVYVGMERQLLGFDLRTGRSQTELAIQGPMPEPPRLVRPDRLVAFTGRNTLTSIDVHTGRSAWQCSLPWPTLAAPRAFALDGLLLVLTDGYQLSSINIENGTIDWTVAIHSRPQQRSEHSVERIGDTVALAQDDWLECRSGKDGRLVWRRPLPKSRKGWRVHAWRGTPLLAGRVGTRIQLRTYGSADGKLAQVFQFDARQDAPAALAIQQDTVALASDDSIWVLALQNTSAPPERRRTE